MSKLVRVEIVHSFKHAGQTFHAGEVRMLSAEDAGFFCGVGWAKASGFTTGELDMSEKTLEVHDVVISHAGESVNG